MAKEKILDILKSSKTIDSAYDIKLNKGQGNLSSSATRKDYVDGEIDKQVSKSGDTMTGSLITSGSLVADGVIRTKYSVETYDTTSTYGIRDTILGSTAYIQAGKVNKDVADQKLMLSGWLGTPLTMSKFSMANGVNPQVQWGSTSYDILHRGNLPNAADVGAVSKTGDTMTGSLSMSGNTEIKFTAYNTATSISNGTGDGASQDATNIQIKSWQGIGISPTAGLPSGMTMGQNSIWINARTGAINSIGSVTASGFKSTNAYAYFSEKAGHGMYLGTTTDNRTLIGGGSATDGAVLIRPLGVGGSVGQTIFETNGTITNSVAPTATGHLTNKGYVDSEIAKQVSKSGDTMTGNLTVPTVNLSGSQSSAPNTVTRKDYVDGEIAKQVSKTGDTMTGNLTAPKVLLSGSQGAEANAATRKDYVDTELAKKLSLAGGTMTGMLTIAPTGTNIPLALQVPAGKGNRILAQIAGANAWYLGIGTDGSNDVYLHSYTHSNYVGLLGDRVQCAKALYAPTVNAGAPGAGSTGLNSAGTELRDANEVLRWYAFYEASTGAYHINRYAGDGNYLSTPLTLDGSGNTLIANPRSKSQQGATDDALVRKDYFDGELSKKLNLAGDGTIAGNLTIATGAPILCLHEVDTTKKWFLVADGYGARFQPDSTGTENSWSSGPDGTFTCKNPHSQSPQGSNAGSLTRKDYVDGQVASLLARIVALESR